MMFPVIHRAILLMAVVSEAALFFVGASRTNDPKTGLEAATSHLYAALPSVASLLLTPVIHS